MRVPCGRTPDVPTCCWREGAAIRPLAGAVVAVRVAGVNTDRGVLGLVLPTLLLRTG